MTEDALEFKYLFIYVKREYGFPCEMPKRIQSNENNHSTLCKSHSCRREVVEA